MAEFKITEKLSDEIAGVKKTGKKINDDYKKVSSEDVDTLDTAVEYLEQHKRIKKLLELYKELVLKDVKDMKSMVKEVEEMDKSISSSHTM